MSAFKNATASLKSALDSAVRTKNTAYGPMDSDTTSFSVSVYSVYADEAISTYHHAAPSLSNSTSGVVNNTDSNSIYRIGSISKPFTVYTFLSSVGDVSWNEPVTKFVPEIEAYASSHAVSDDAIDVFNWSDTTLGILASQLGGMPRDAVESADDDIILSQDLAPELHLPLNIPHVPDNSSEADCVNQMRVPCNRESLFRNIFLQNPSVAPTSQPVYSNLAYKILVYALEKMTNTSYESLFELSFVKALQLNATYYNHALIDRGVVPHNATAATWYDDIYDVSPAGSSYSSVNDIQSIGRSILNSTLLSKSLTSCWLKPHTFTGSDSLTVGAPWEIYQAPSKGIEGKVRWMYTKGGDVGSYGTFTILLPEYGIGDTLLAAGDDFKGVQNAIPSLMNEILVPTSDTTAKQEESRIFVGQYKQNSRNGTVTIDIDDGPGLRITRWISSGSNIVEAITEHIGEVRLFPSGLESKTGTRIGFGEVTETVKPTVGEMSSGCQDWFGVSKSAYGVIALDDWVITLNENKTAALSVEPMAWRTSYSRV